MQGPRAVRSVGSTASRGAAAPSYERGSTMASSVGSGPTTTARAAARDRSTEADDSGTGWVLFAGSMIALVGLINFIYGIAAIDNSQFYVGDAEFVISDLNTWGWFL